MQNIANLSSWTGRLALAGLLGSMLSVFPTAARAAGSEEVVSAKGIRMVSVVSLSGDVKVTTWDKDSIQIRSSAKVLPEIKVDDDELRIGTRQITVNGMDGLGALIGRSIGKVFGIADDDEGDDDSDQRRDLERREREREERRREREKRQEERHDERDDRRRDREDERAHRHKLRYRVKLGDVGPMLEDLEATLGADLEIKIPRSVRLTVKNISGDVEARGLQARARLVSVSGDIEVEDCTDDVEVKAVSGDLDIRNVSGDITAKVVSGNIQIRDSKTAYIEAKSVSGDVDLRNVTVRRGRIESQNGDIEFQGAIEGSGDLEMETFDGRLLLELPKDASFELDARTRHGRIRLDRKMELSRESDRRIRGKAGAGDAEIEIDSFNGNITVK